MKVKSLGTTSRNLVDDIFTARRDNSQGSQNSFGRHMHTLAHEMYEEQIAELATKIEAQSRRLSQKADLTEMERYRQLITELLAEVVANAYSFRKDRVIDARGRIKICATISKINEKLDELAQEILTGSQSCIDLISKIDDIRGLLVDIML